MLRRPLLLVALPLVGAAAWWGVFLLWPDPQLDRPYNLLPYLPLALPALITLATRFRAAPPWLAILWTTYAAAMTLAFTILGLFALLAFGDNSGSNCPDDKIYC